MTPPYNSDYVLPILERAIAERNDERGSGGAARVAEELGCTDSLISQLRTGNYPSPARKYLQIVEKYGKETVNCPVIGEISLERCSRERDRSWSATNPTRLALSQTCPVCDRRKS